MPKLIEKPGQSPQPYWQSADGRFALYHGDCLRLLAIMKQADAIISDPPYGAKNDCNYTRFSGGKNPLRNFNGRSRNSSAYLGIAGDDAPFDPTPFLDYPEVILWGFQFFANKLPQGTVLVWNKKRDNQLGIFLSDGELAWFNKGKGVYLFPHIWHGMDRESEAGEKTLHPSQKPVALMEWCLSKVEGKVILDPYVGSGSTGVACIRAGRRFIGIEIEERYCKIAAKRMIDELDEWNYYDVIAPLPKVETI